MVTGEAVGDGIDVVAIQVTYDKLFAAIGSTQVHDGLLISGHGVTSGIRPMDSAMSSRT